MLNDFSVTQRKISSEDALHHTSSVSFEIGNAGTGQPSIVYPQLSFHPQRAFLLGSPIGGLASKFWKYGYMNTSIILEFLI